MFPNPNVHIHICFDTTEAMLLLNKELKPNMVWGLWPETKCGIFLKNNFFFFLRDSKAQKLFSFLLLYNSVQITHIFFVRRHFLFSVYLQITNTKPSTKIYIPRYSKEQEKILLPSDKKVLLFPPIMQVKIAH